MIKVICTIQLVFIALKITEQTRWNWWVVTSPSILLTTLVLGLAIKGVKYGDQNRV